MKKILLLLVLAGVVSGCAAQNPYGYGSSYSGQGIPTLALAATGAALGSQMGSRHSRTGNAIVGGLIGATVGVAVEGAMQEEQRRRDYQAQGSYRQHYYQQQVRYQQPRRVASHNSRNGSYRRVSGTSQLHVRSGPGNSYPVVGVLRGGERIRVVGYRSGWAHIASDDGFFDGWVRSRYLRG